MSRLVGVVDGAPTLAGGAGDVVVLNGAPRSGKSSIAAAIQDSFDGVWMNIGVDSVMATTPPSLLPGLGLRPGGERPDLGPFVRVSYAALFDSVVAYSRYGLNVVVDVGIHDSYSVSLGVLADVSTRMTGMRAFFVGVRCSVDVILDRRDNEPRRGEVRYLGRGDDGSVPPQVQLWEDEVHRPGVYDLEVDTTDSSPAQCAEEIRRLCELVEHPSAFRHISQTVTADQGGVP